MIAARTSELPRLLSGRTEANAVSEPSSLEYSFRDACLPELNARLRAEGFEPPGRELAAWVRLARIVQVDAASITIEELVEEASAWADRVRVTERIRAQLVGPGSSDRESSPRSNYFFSGSLDWGNWGLGMDVESQWHLFHIMAGGCGTGWRSRSFRPGSLMDSPEGWWQVTGSYHWLRLRISGGSFREGLKSRSEARGRFDHR